MVRLRGLRAVKDITELCTALTHHLGTPISVPVSALHEGSHFLQLLFSTFSTLFTNAPSHTYIDPLHHYSIHIESRAANGEPFFLPDSPIKPPTNTRLKKPKRPKSKSQGGGQVPPPPTGPPPGFQSTCGAATSASLSKPPRRNAG